MKFNLAKLAHVAAAGALVLSISAFDALRVGPEPASAREAQATRGAQAARPELSSGITIQNLGDSAATVSLTFVNSSGSNVLTYAVPGTIAAKSQYTITTPNITNLPDGFAGSVLVDSDQPVAAIVNLEAPSDAGGSNTDPFRGASYVGVGEAETASTLYVPQVMRYGNWNSTVSVQNAGSAPAVVTITYKNRSGAAVAADSAADTVTIAAGATHNFKQADRSALGTSFIGSAVVTTSTSGAKLAAITRITNSFADGENSQFFAYNAQATGGKKLYAPRLGNNYYGYSSGITIQNTSNSTANLTINLSFGGGSVQRTVTDTVDPLAAKSYYLPAVADAWGIPSGAALGKGSAVIDSDQNIVAIVNEDNRETAGLIGRGDTYRAFVDGSQTSTVYLPVVYAAAYGYASGITIQNASASQAATVSIRMVNRNGEEKTITESIGPNSSIVRFAPDLWGTDSSGSYRQGFLGSATITSTGGQIFVISDQSCRTDVGGCTRAFGDSLSMYNGVNR